MQGARTTRTSRPSLPGNSFSNFSAPAMAQDRESHTRTVTGGGGSLAFLHHIEMRVEGCDLIDLGERHLHLGGERGEMGGRQITVLILNQMKVLDQQIAPARPVGEQPAHLLERLRIDLAALGRARRAAAATRAVAPERGGFWVFIA